MMVSPNRMTSMTTIDTLKQLARIDDMLALRDEAQRAGDPESLLVVKMMERAVADTRDEIRRSVSATRFSLLASKHPRLVTA